MKLIKLLIIKANHYKQGHQNIQHKLLRAFIHNKV